MHQGVPRTPCPWEPGGPAAVRFRWLAKPVSAQGSVRPVPFVSRAAWFKVASPEIIQVSPGHLDPAAHDPPSLDTSCYLRSA